MGLQGSVRGVNLGEVIVGSNLNLTDVNIWALSMKPGQEGQLLYNKNWKAPASWAGGNQTLSWSTSMNNNVGFVWSKETRQWWCFNLQTGEYLWGPTAPEQYLGIYGTSTAIGNGKFYQCYMSGIVYCYDIQSGKLLWTQNIKDPDNEILWSDNWPMRIQFIVDDKIYLVEGEHSPNQPLPRGAPMVCLNATTGELIWSLSMMYYYRTNGNRRQHYSIDEL
jgi:outer membrane protein assembly factor BamB